MPKCVLTVVEMAIVSVRVSLRGLLKYDHNEGLNSASVIYTFTLLLKENIDEIIN